jgi:hypothetical protein
MRLPIQLFAVLATCSTYAWANPIFTIAPGACPNTPAVCTATNGIVTAGLFTATLEMTTDSLLNDFQSAFDSWNNPMPAASQWTMVKKDLSDTAKLTVSTYRAYVNEGANCGVTCGGAEIQIDYTPGAASDPGAIADPNNIGSGDAVWSQSIDTSAKRDPSLPGNPYLDNAPGTAGANLGPPAYPFQYAGSFFYDKPGRDATAIWTGDAFITTANYTTRTLTVYDGVFWGFTVVPVPEPSTFVLMAGLGALALAFRPAWRA